MGYVTPADKLAARAEAILATRPQRLMAAAARRRAKSQGTGFAKARLLSYSERAVAEDEARRGRDLSMT